MKRCAVFCLFLLVATTAFAQRQKITINAETPEGALLQQIGQQEDEAKKLALMEEFIQKHPKHEGAAWVYSQMVPAYTKAQQYDKAMDAAEKLLAVDPEDAEMAHAALKAAESKNDPDAVKKWALKTSEAARRVAASKKPQDEDEAAEWTKRVDWAKQVDVYAEYSLYAMGLKSTDLAKRLMLFEALAQLNEKSQYMANVTGPMFVAYKQAGNRAKALELAQKAAAANQAGEDMYLVLASDSFEGMKDKPKALDYSAKVVELAQASPKPQGVADADWEKAKGLKLGLAHYMIGVVHSSDEKWAQADTELRAALPLVKDNNDLLAETLFHLGVANFRLGDKATGDTQKTRILDAVRFFQQCAGMKSRFTAVAAKNLAAIRSQYHIR